MDEKENLEGEVRALRQTLSHLALHSTSHTSVSLSTTVTSDPNMIAAATAITEKKKKMDDIVSACSRGDKINIIAHGILIGQGDCTYCNEPQKRTKEKGWSFH